MKKTLLIIAVILLAVSCKTAEVQTEYIPVELDVETLIEPILELKPEDVKLIDAPQDLSDIMENSVSFQYAYENWKSYALTLEQFYLSLNDAQAETSSEP